MHGCTVYLVRTAKSSHRQVVGGVEVPNEVYIVPTHRNTHQSSRSCTPTDEDHDKCLELLRWNATTNMFGTCLTDDFEAIVMDVTSYRFTEVPAEAIYGVLRLGGVSILLLITKLLPVAGGAHFPDFGPIYEVGGLTYVVLPLSSGGSVASNGISTTPSTRPQRCSPTHNANRPSDADLVQYFTILERYCKLNSHCGAKGLYLSFSADIAVPVSAHPGGKNNSPPTSVLTYPDLRGDIMGEIMLPESTNSLSSTPDGATALKTSKPAAYHGSRSSKYRGLFCWNANMCSTAFPDHRFVPPIVRGFIGGGVVGGVNVALFSRQSPKYAGTRYNRRGLSKDGVPANFVESEQVVWRGSFDQGGRPVADASDVYPRVSSFTIFRGSVPVDWSQRPDLTSKPQTVVHADPFAAFSDHMKVLEGLYPAHHIGCVNLMTAKGIEAKLTEVFQSVVEEYNTEVRHLSEPGSAKLKPMHNGRFTPSKSPMSKTSASPALNGFASAANISTPVSFLHYNLGDSLHQKMSFAEIQAELVNRLATEMATTLAVGGANGTVGDSSKVDPATSLLSVDSWSYRLAKGGNNTTSPSIALCKSPSLGSVSFRLVVDRKSQQSSVIRVNCLDCLDRTNVAQSMLATAALRQQLVSLEEEPARWVQVEDAIKALWVEHGHRISMLYAGSNAHFSDIIRLGRPAPKSLLNPYPMARIAMRRFVLQNFHDGDKQDCLSLVTGHHVPCAPRDPDQATLHRPEVPNTIIKCSLVCVAVLWVMLVGDHFVVHGGAFTKEICFGYASFMLMIGVMVHMVVKRRKALVVGPLLR